VIVDAGPPQFGAVSADSGDRLGGGGRDDEHPAQRKPTTISSSPGRPRAGIGVWGVMDLQSTFGLPLEAALEVSDHNPVLAAVLSVRGPADARAWRRARRPPSGSGQTPLLHPAQRAAANW